MTMTVDIADTIRRMSARYAYDRIDLNDIAQEGMIAAWQELEKGNPSGWGINAAKYRMRQISTGHRPQLGEERKRGQHTKDATRLSQCSVEHLPEAVVESELFQSQTSDVVNEQFIVSLLSTLDDDDLEVVWLMFWKDMSQHEIARTQGVSQTRVAYRWREIIKPTLRARYNELTGSEHQ